jgi:hypothetical protein
MSLGKKCLPYAFPFFNRPQIPKNEIFFWTNEMAPVILTYLQNAEPFVFFLKIKDNQTRTQVISSTGFFEIPIFSFYLLLVSIQKWRVTHLFPNEGRL